MYFVLLFYLFCFGLFWFGLFFFFHVFSTFHFPCLHVSVLPTLPSSKFTLTLYAHFQYFKRRFHSFLLFFFFLSFLFPLCSVAGCNMTFRLWFFFQLDFRFCHVPLHSAVLNILLCPPFSMVHPATISLLFPPPLAFLFLCYSCCVSSECHFSGYFFLPVLLFYSSVFASWTLPILTTHISFKTCMCTFRLFVFLVSSGTRWKELAVTDCCLPKNFCRFGQIWLWLQLGAAKLCFPVQLVLVMSYSQLWIQSPLLTSFHYKMILVSSLKGFIIPC